jgi:hypothetical protein
MTEPTPPTDRPDGSVCPWCSATVTPETVTCPSCAAVLLSDEEPNLPGVTAVDMMSMRAEKPPQRNRLLSWISGEYVDETQTTADAQAIAPPDPEVQREIRRLEVEAEVASLQAEADAILSEAVVEGRTIEVPEGIRPLEINEPVASGEDEASAEGGTPADDEATADGTTADGETPPDGETPA